MLKKYSFKIIQSGNETEIYSYEQEQLKKISSENNDLKDDFMDDDIEDEVLKNTENKMVDDGNTNRRKSNIDRTKQKMRRLVTANMKQWKYTDKFVTLTFADNEDGSQVDRDQVVKCFRRFRERFKYRYGKNCEYIAVIERGTQATERLHIHMIVFNLPYIKHKDLIELWKYGWVTVNKIKTVDDVRKYMLKYIEKTLEDDYIPKGKKFYFTSKGLKKPQEIFLTDEEMAEYIENKNLGKCITTCEFQSEFIEGSCTYARYFLNENIED